MKKLEFILEKSDRCFIFPNGKIIHLFPYTYGAKIDLENETYISHDSGEEFENSTLPTINDLVEQGILIEASCIEKEHSIRFGVRKRVLTNNDIRNIIKEFAEHGLKVSRKAIMHNYECWLGDLKSGFRDDKNGTHLFTPCRHNPLQFHATSLGTHSSCDWQETYYC